MQIRIVDGLAVKYLRLSVEIGSEIEQCKLITFLDRFFFWVYFCWKIEKPANCRRKLIESFSNWKIDLSQAISKRKSEEIEKLSQSTQQEVDLNWIELNVSLFESNSNYSRLKFFGQNTFVVFWFFQNNKLLSKTIKTIQTVLNNRKYLTNLFIKL